jgi:hypothetical protein
VTELQGVRSERLSLGSKEARSKVGGVDAVRSEVQKILRSHLETFSRFGFQKSSVKS